MDKKTQLKLIQERIDQDGYISRNWCLKNFISRLSAYIYDLNKLGYRFEGKSVKTEYGHDFVYYKVNKPIQIGLF